MRTKIILTSLIIIPFLACTNENKAGVNSMAQTEAAHGHSTAAENQITALSLNKGSKWQTDESTWVHAENLNALVDAYDKKDNADSQSSQVFAAAIQEELGALVKDCKMTGADHDALHLWLKPVMKGVSDLKKAGTAEEGKHIAEKLATDVKKFNQYFKNAH